MSTGVGVVIVTHYRLGQEFLEDRSEGSNFNELVTAHHKERTHQHRLLRNARENTSPRRISQRE